MHRNETKEARSYQIGHRQMVVDSVRSFEE